MQRVLQEIERAKDAFRELLQGVAARGGMTEELYVRYLSFQHHLTKGVQRHFLKCAAHPCMSGKMKLRQFLFDFGIEEEPHYHVAEVDLKNLGYRPLSCPLDVALWWAYFDGVVEERPFVRLGATCVLENLGAGAGGVGRDLLEKAPFLNERNTRFLDIHFHEVLPHGDQILAALGSVRLEEQDLLDLVEGARTGATLYMRLASWALRTDPLLEAFPVFDEELSHHRL